jgi:hypothetical protein
MPPSSRRKGSLSRQLPHSSPGRTPPAAPWLVLELAGRHHEESLVIPSHSMVRTVDYANSSVSFYPPEEPPWDGWLIGYFINCFSTHTHSHTTLTNPWQLDRPIATDEAGGTETTQPSWVGVARPHRYLAAKQPCRNLRHCRPVFSPECQTTIILGALLLVTGTDSLVRVTRLGVSPRD